MKICMCDVYTVYILHLQGHIESHRIYMYTSRGQPLKSKQTLGNKPANIFINQ